MDKQYLEILPEPEKIQVVVLMGGLGSRLGEQTKGCPKPLVDVGGRPFLIISLTCSKDTASGIFVSGGTQGGNDRSPLWGWQPLWGEDFLFL